MKTAVYLILLFIAVAAINYSGQRLANTDFYLVSSSQDIYKQSRIPRNCSETSPEHFRSEHDSSSPVLMFQVVIIKWDLTTCDAIW